jgi:hypothetical protein
MGNQKDDPRVIEFMRLFHELKDWTGDSAHLRLRAPNETSLKRLCHDISFAAISLELKERGRRELFIERANSRFIEAWRTYQDNWDATVSDIVWDDLGIAVGDFAESDARDEFTRRWELADEEAQEVAKGFDMAMDRATESVEFGEFPEDYVESIDDAVREFRRLPERIGFDVRGILRRRSLIPVVLIPKHVADRHGEKHGPHPDKKTPLRSQLQQSQEAFIYGIPFAGISLMRALIELVLTYHYGFVDADVCDKLNRLSASKERTQLHNLRMLANDVLHFGETQSRSEVGRQARLEALVSYGAWLAEPKKSLPKKDVIQTERDFIFYLLALRTLIEKAQ